MRYLALFILTLLFWLLLTFDLSVSNLVAGAVAALITSLLFGRYFYTKLYKFLQPVRYFWLVIYLVILIWECIKANIDVAYRVLHPAMPIKSKSVDNPLDYLWRVSRAIRIKFCCGSESVVFFHHP